MIGSGRVAIVTGAAGGIGGAITRALLAVGVRVVAVDRPGAPFGALGGGDHLLTVPADLTEDSAVAEIVGAARAKFGGVDILVNNAGIGQESIRPDNWQRPIKFWEVSTAQWRQFLQVHTSAPLALSGAVVPGMIEAGWGRIVTVTTSLGTMLRSGFPTYGPSKAALEAMTAIMAKDLAGSGVTVNVLVPGGVTNTGMVVAQSGFDRSKMIQPEVMAPPLVWLVSEAAGAITGKRFLAIDWDTALPPDQAAAKAAAPIAWEAIAAMPVEPE
jgi:NAD(P)-dependent dehydrogenase (short-subunit alcohol dehydrogenase family)